jgi:hypothetical protein
MRRFAPPPATPSTRLDLALLGLLSLASADVSILLAQSHLSLCGAGQAAHCGWCYAAAGFALLAVGSLAGTAHEACGPAPSQG